MEGPRCAFQATSELHIPGPCLTLFRLLHQMPQTQGLKQHTFVPHSYGSWQFKIKLLGDSVPGVGSSWLVDSPLFTVSSHSREQALVSLPPLLMALMPSWEPYPMTSADLNHVPKAPLPETVTWELGPQHRNLGVGHTNVQSIAVPKYLPLETPLL